jgi:uncharacterized OB-fold protein
VPQPAEVKPVCVACPDCGLVSPTGSKFCEHCGKRLALAAAAVQAMPELSAPVASVAAPEPLPSVAASDDAPLPAVISGDAAPSSAIEEPTVREGQPPETQPAVEAESPQAEPAPVAVTPEVATVPAEPFVYSPVIPIASASATEPTSSESALLAQSSSSISPAPISAAEMSASSASDDSVLPLSQPAVEEPSVFSGAAAAQPAALPANTANSIAQLCEKCGTPLLENAKFCEKCGTRTAAAQSPALTKNTPTWTPDPGPKTDQIFITPQSTSKGPLMLIVVLLVVLGLAGLAAWKFFSGPDVSVTVAQPRVTVSPGETVSLLASVSGSSDTDVVWSLKEGTKGGRLSPEGVSMGEGRVQSAASYVAPQQAGTYHVTAASHANSNRKAIIEVVVGDGNASGQNSSASAGNSLSEQIVGTWQWPKPADDLRMQIAADGSIVIESASQATNARRGTYKVSDSKRIEVKMDDGESRKFDVLSIDGDSMRVMSQSRDGVSAMTFTRKAASN